MKKWTIASVVVTAVVLGHGGAAADSGGANWSVAGGDLQNTRHQGTEGKLGPANVGSLSVKWAFTTGGDVSATPAVDDDRVYVPDWAGQPLCRRPSHRPGGLAADDRRRTPASPATRRARRRPSPTALSSSATRARSAAAARSSPSTRTLAPSCGRPRWRATSRRSSRSRRRSTTASVYVGVASLEEALAAFIPGYVVLQLPRQHGRARPARPAGSLEDIHGPGGLPGQRGLGQLAGDRHQARLGLHRDGQQLQRPGRGARVRRRGRGRSGRRAACLARRRPLRLDRSRSTCDRRDQVGDARAAVRRVDGRLHPSATGRTAPSRRVRTTTSARHPRSHGQGRGADGPSSSVPARRAASTGPSTPTPARSSG